MDNKHYKWKYKNVKKDSKKLDMAILFIFTQVVFNLYLDRERQRYFYRIPDMLALLR